MDLNCHKDFGKFLLFSFKVLSIFFFTCFSLCYLFSISMFKQSKLDLKIRLSVIRSVSRILTTEIFDRQLPEWALSRD